MWIRGTQLEARAVRALMRREGLDQSELLRRFSLNDIVRQYQKVAP